MTVSSMAVEDLRWNAATTSSADASRPGEVAKGLSGLLEALWRKCGYWPNRLFVPRDFEGRSTSTIEVVRSDLSPGTLVLGYVEDGSEGYDPRRFGVLLLANLGKVDERFVEYV